MLIDPRYVDLLHHRKAYRVAEPFPHVVIQFSEEPWLREVAAEFPAADDPRWFLFHGANVQHKLHIQMPEHMGPRTVALLDWLNGPEWMAAIRLLTGFKDLVPDYPGLSGAGLHAILRGGSLNVHADFNWNKRIKAVRKVNLLLYLNDPWPDEWGGFLGLWSNDLSHPVVSVPPRLGTMVIFNTTDTSYHGHPVPLAAPDGVMRKSIALYYYSPGDRPHRTHNTVYKELH